MVGVSSAEGEKIRRGIIIVQGLDKKNLNNGHDFSGHSV